MLKPDPSQTPRSARRYFSEPRKNREIFNLQAGRPSASQATLREGQVNGTSRVDTTLVHSQILCIMELDPYNTVAAQAKSPRSNISPGKMSPK